MLDKFSVARITGRQPKLVDLSSKLQDLSQLQQLFFTGQRDWLVAKIKHNARQSTLFPFLASTPVFFDGAAGSVLRRRPASFPHNADKDVVVDRYLPVDHILRRTEI